MQSRRIIPAVLIAILGGSSCGKSEREITLITPIPIVDPTKNLSSVFDPASAGSASLAVIGVGDLANACHQTEFRAGYASGDAPPTELLDVSLDTVILATSHSLANQASAPYIYSATGWLNANSALRAPIRFKVPNTGDLKIGFRGVLYEPMHALNSAGAACAKYDPTLSGSDPQTFLVNALRPLPPDVDTVAVSPFVLKTNLGAIAYATPNPPPGLSNPTPLTETTVACFDLSNSRSCPNRDLLEFKFSYSFSPPAAGIRFVATYFPTLGVHALSHRFKLNASPAYLYVNDDRMIPLDYIDGSNNLHHLRILTDQHQVKEGTLTQNMILTSSAGATPKYEGCLPWGGALSPVYTSPGNCNDLTLTIQYIGNGF
ncbi:MAG: hypothetical protein EBX52_02965 [Proteobacteria bacterium]|nr:hypothetical protein [Pseudomonadota bacterium]